MKNTRSYVSVQLLNLLLLYDASNNYDSHVAHPVPLQIGNQLRFSTNMHITVWRRIIHQHKGIRSSHTSDNAKVDFEATNYSPQYSHTFPLFPFKIVEIIQEKHHSQ